ncbi:NAD(P)-binding protein [Trichodelitschia bisporula]|uniref:NADP-dependent mannitol dehydrogenase n=1 Tax=Trichodelitschia bisporula TaxID=703511 RepID=A0A6G1HQN2_9PEZI|nr:NAD(P)-binding protein [Trichodelitschia bisporula]
MSTPSAPPAGEFSRTDPTISTTYPAHLPPTTPPNPPKSAKRTLPIYSLEGKVAVVTGGARGLGLVMAQALVESGADVALVDINEGEARTGAEGLLNTYMAANPGASEPIITAHYADVSSPDSVTACIASILNTHTKIDVLVTSAGFTENLPATEYPFERLKALWSVNVDGTWLFAVGVAKHMMSRGARGSIILIGSMSGAIVNVPQPQAPYNASKAAVRHLAASLAVEWAGSGVRVNCISPGYMRTALTEKIMDENPELRDKWTSLIPVGRMGTPEDLKGPVTFLASDASAYITGADLRVDGGYTVT